MSDRRRALVSLSLVVLAERNTCWRRRDDLNEQPEALLAKLGGRRRGERVGDERSQLSQ